MPGSIRRRPKGRMGWFERAKAARQAARPHGYVAVLGLETYDTARLVNRIEAGLPMSALSHFIRNTALPSSTAARLVGLTARTLARRKLEKHLRADESDRLVRAARLYAQVVELFEGDEGQARRWITAPQPALGGEIPVRYASTEVGARAVEELIGRLENGIPS